MTKKSYKITILGCGGSIGVPSVERGWENCDPNEPKNYRMRTSALIEVTNSNVSQKVSQNSEESYNILIDAGPDFRQQALKNNIKKIDTVLFTHAHADHILGIDELRSINRIMKKSINAYAFSTTSNIIKEMFSYVFKPHPVGVKDLFYRPQLNLFDIEYYKEFQLDNNSTILPTQQVHGRIETTGFVIDGRIGYATDFVSLPSETIEKYKNLDLLVISAFTRKEHDAHMRLQSVLELIEYVSPQKAILTHMGATMDYNELMRELPTNVLPAYDGMVIEVE